MQIDQLKVGQLVRCPSDRGDPGYVGKVLGYSTEVNTTSTGSTYVWVEVHNPIFNHKSVWPSNRLGKY
jgi:hypothetical protein